MPDSFSISPATSIDFKILTESENIRADDIIRNNYLNAEFSDFHGCGCLSEEVEQAQVFKSDDTTTVQFEWSRAGFSLMAIAKDGDGNIVKVWGTDGGQGITNPGGGDIYEIDIDFNRDNFVPGECHSIEIVSYSDVYNESLWGGITVGDNGTFENNISNLEGGGNGGNQNTLSQSGIEFRTGIKSLKCLAPGAPTAENGLLWSAGSSDITLSKGFVYRAQGYVWNDTLLPIISAGSIGFEILNNDGFGSITNITGWNLSGFPVGQTSFQAGVDPDGSWEKNRILLRPNGRYHGKIKDTHIGHTHIIIICLLR